MQTGVRKYWSLELVRIIKYMIFWEIFAVEAEGKCWLLVGSNPEKVSKHLFEIMNCTSYGNGFASYDYIVKSETDCLVFGSVCSSWSSKNFPDPKTVVTWWSNLSRFNNVTKDLSFLSNFFKQTSYFGNQLLPKSISSSLAFQFFWIFRRFFWR